MKVKVKTTGATKPGMWNIELVFEKEDRDLGIKLLKDYRAAVYATEMGSGYAPSCLLGEPSVRVRHAHASEVGEDELVSLTWLLPYFDRKDVDIEFNNSGLEEE